jgi:hypothetical protein
MMKISSSAPPVLHAGVSFTIILDDIARRLEMLQKTCITHFASERFWPWSFRVEFVSLAVITPSTARRWDHASSSPWQF